MDKKIESNLERLNLILKSIRDVNQLITKENRRNTLLKGICDKLVENLGYNNVWIALFDKSGKFTSIFEAGVGNDIIPLVKYFNAGELTNCAQKALTKSEIIITDDPNVLCTKCPLPKKYKDRGALSARLEHDDYIYGVITISANITSIQNIDELYLFEELARDIGFALYNIEQEENRKNTETNLLREKFYIESIMDSLPGMFYLFNDQGKFLRWNKNFEKISGYSATEITRIHPLDLFKGTDKQLVAERIQEALIKGEASVEAELISKNGTGVPYFFTGNRVIFDQMHCVVGMGVDITRHRKAEAQILETDRVMAEIKERKQEEAKLRFVSQYTRSLIEASLDPLVTISSQGKITDVNNATEQVTGLLREQLIGSDFSDYFMEPEKAREGYTQVFTKGFVRDYPLAIRHKSGKITQVLYNATVYKNEVGEIQGVFAAARDITERNEAEEKARASSLYARSLIEASLDPLVTISSQGKITDVNNATEQATGLLREQLIGSDFSDYFTKPEKAREGYTQAFTKGFVRDYPLAIRHKSGKITQVLYNATVYKNEVGEIQGVFAAARDITERNEAEEKARASSLYARSLIEASLDPLVTISSQGKITDVNNATEQATGLLREQLIGSDFSDYFTKPEKAREGYTQVFTKGFVRDYPLAIRHKSGKITQVLYNATVYKNEIGEIQGVFASARDVTELKEAERQIREQADLLNNAHDAITVRDTENRIKYWNKGAELLYGWKSEEIVGKKGYEILYNENSSQFPLALKTVMEKGKWTGELQHITKSKKEVIVDSRWTLMRDNSGKPSLIMTINTDITEKKKLETQFLRTQRMESIGTLASGIAHDLNNILTPIMLSMDIFKKKLNNKQDLELLEMIEVNVKRGADLIRQVLSFARGVEGELQPVQIKRLIDEIEKTMKETFPKSINISVSIPPDLKEIMGDFTKLHQVLMNLCVNARDAMPFGGSLNISAENVYIDENYAHMNFEAKTGPHVMISVIDTGIGMPPNVMDKLFEPFFTTKKQGEGTGLGLSTALAIVKSHSGFIHVYSEVGNGSTFKVFLPAVSLNEEKEKEKQQVQLFKGNEELILVVDDEELIRKVTSDTLIDNGYKVITASDGSEAMALYVKNEEKIRVILLDLMMPIMDGRACIRGFRKLNPAVKIIAMSGLSKNGKSPTISEQANAFLVKPYTAEKLLTTIRDVLNQ